MFMICQQVHAIWIAGQTVSSSIAITAYPEKLETFVSARNNLH